MFALDIPTVAPIVVRTDNGSRQTEYALKINLLHIWHNIENVPRARAERDEP